MKNFFIYCLLVASLLSWILFFILSFISLLPNQALQSLNASLPSSYDFEYSEVVNGGSFLNPILEFSDIIIRRDDFEFYSAKKSDLGIILSPGLLIGRVTLNHIHIKDANIILPDDSGQRISNLKVILDEDISISIQNTSFSQTTSNILVNGKLSRLLPGLANGQLTINHNGEISNISVNSDGISSNLYINLYKLNWLKYFPNNYPTSSQALNFGLNIIASVTPEGSSAKGSVSIEDTSFDSFILKRNYGSFSFQSIDGQSILSLSNFLHPFVDEQFPIKFDLSKKTIAIPDIFLSKEVLELSNPQFSNLTLKNIFASFQNGAIKYSGEIIDLDLLDIYFDEVLNIQGFFSGINTSIKFLITPSKSFIRNKEGELHPLQIAGKASLNSAGLHLKTQIGEFAGSISLKLDIPFESNEPLAIKLSGNNVSKKMILASLPKNLKSASRFIDLNMELSLANKIFINYQGSTPNSDATLLLKLLLDNSKISISDDLAISIQQGVIEINQNNLYAHFLSGSVDQVPIDAFYGNLNFSSQRFQYVSQHDLSNKELSKLANNNSLFDSVLNAKATSKGFFNIFSQKQYNSISAQTEILPLPLYKSNLLTLQKGQIFVSEFNRLYGRIPAQFLNKDSIIFMHGKNLLEKYELDFLFEIPLSPKIFIPDFSILRVSGEDIFSTVLSVHKNTPTVLKIYSDLNGVEFKSNLPFLQKIKSSLLPTEIEIRNFLKPEIFIKNSLIELKINSLQHPKGYISLGTEIPQKYNFIKNAKGLNLYLGLDTLTADILTNLYQTETTDKSLTLNNFFFDIGHLEVFKNQFKQITGSLSFGDMWLEGNIKADKLNAKFVKDNSGFLKIQLEDTHLKDMSFLKAQIKPSLIKSINARLTVKNSSIQDLQINFLDLYLQKNKNLFTMNNINLSSNLISISSLANNSQAYFSVDNKNDIYKLRGSYLVKDSSKIPLLKDIIDFSYFNGDINLQWQNLKRLQDIEGTLNFILKDLVVTNQATNSIALNLLGILNLKNILGKVANLDLTIDEFTSTQLNRVQGELVFNQSKARLATPLFIDTNAAKMKWIGQINKNAIGELSNLDLSLDLRVRIGENIPWYAAVLGGIPAVAGSALISEIFENNINDLSNYQYEVSGAINAPKIERIN